MLETFLFPTCFHVSVISSYQQCHCLHIVCKMECIVVFIHHAVYLIRKAGWRKILRSCRSPDEEVLVCLPRGSDYGINPWTVSHIAAHRHKVAEIIKAILKGMLGIHTAQGKASESPVVTGIFQVFRRSIIVRPGMVFALYSRDQVIQ